MSNVIQKNSRRKRSWTTEELHRLRAAVAAGDSTSEIAARLGRTVSMVTNAKQRHRLTRRLRLGDDFAEFIRSHHAMQWTDHEIVAEWNRIHPDPDHGSICRECVSKRRRRLGLPSNATAPRQREKTAAKTREQLEKIGLRNLGELHRLKIRERIKAMGWPEDLRFREAQILTLLWEQGPKTKREIAEGIGMRLHQMSRRMLKSNGSGGNYLADLMQRGFIISYPRIVKTDAGRGNNVTLYSLPLTVDRGKVAS